MHLSEGVLHTPVLLGGAAVALVCVMIGLKRLNSQQLPLTALLLLLFLLRVHSCTGWHWQRASHLKRHGRPVSRLGRFPCFFNRIGITSPALFPSGGFAVLGVNLCVMALPALLVRWLFAKNLKMTIPVALKLQQVLVLV